MDSEVVERWLQWCRERKDQKLALASTLSCLRYNGTRATTRTTSSRFHTAFLVKTCDYLIISATDVRFYSLASQLCADASKMCTSQGIASILRSPFSAWGISLCTSLIAATLALTFFRTLGGEQSSRVSDIYCMMNCGTQTAQSLEPLPRCLLSKPYLSR